MVAHSAEREMYWKNIVRSVVGKPAYSKDRKWWKGKRKSVKRIVLQLGIRGLCSLIEECIKVGFLARSGPRRRGNE